MVLQCTYVDSHEHDVSFMAKNTSKSTMFQRTPDCQREKFILPVNEHEFLSQPLDHRMDGSRIRSGATDILFGKRTMLKVRAKLFWRRGSFLETPESVRPVAPWIHLLIHEVAGGRGNRFLLAVANVFSLLH